MAAITTEGNVAEPARNDTSRFIETEKYRWEAPPIPPIPADSVETWRRRASKRASYTSAISNGNPDGAEQPPWSRPVSSASTLAGWMWKGSTRDLTEEQRKLHEIWAADPGNPRNWGRWKKCYHAFACFFAAFAVSTGATIVVPAQRRFKQRYQASTVITALPFALYVLGLAAGPLLLAPCSRLSGRKVLYLVSLIFTGGLTVGAAFVPSLPAVLVLRYLAGTAGSPSLTIGYSVIQDLWATSQRATPAALSRLMPLLGVVVGFVIGGPIAQELPWSWSLHVFACVIAASVVLVLPTSESQRKAIIGRKASSTGRWSSAAKAFTEVIQGAITVHFTQPAVLGLSFYMAVGLAPTYAILAAFSSFFATQHHLSLITQGLAFLSMVAGVSIAVILILVDHILVYGRKHAQWRAARAAEKAQHESLAASRKGNRRPSRDTRRSASRESSGSRVLSKRKSRRGSLTISMKGLTSRETLASQLGGVESGKNAHISVATANYLNSIPENQGKDVKAERVLLILNDSPAFGELCERLSEYKLRFDRVQLAKVLVDAVGRIPVTPSTDDLASMMPPLARSKSMQHEAALAALEAPKPAASPLPRPSAPPGMTYYKAEDDAPPSRHSLAPSPPARWRLWLALPASLLMPASLFMLAWTASPRISLAAPLVGLGLYACSLSLALVACSQYLVDRYRTQDRENALSGAFMLQNLLSFAFVLLAVPLYTRLGVAWATSVLAFLTLGFGVVPWICYFYRPSAQKKSGR